MYLLPLELAALLEIAGEVLKEEKQISEECQQPEGWPYFCHLFGVLADDLNLGEDVQIVEEPVEQEEAPDDDVEDVINSHVWSQQIFNLFGLVHALQQSEKLTSISHVGWVEGNVLKRESNFLAASLFPDVSNRCFRNLQAYWMALQNLSLPSEWMHSYRFYRSISLFCPGSFVILQYQWCNLWLYLD